MPGMMDTILNLGLNDEAVRGLAERTGNARFANDSYRRLIQMYGEVVDGIAGHLFEDALSRLKQERGAAQDVDLSADDLGALVETFKRIYESETGGPFPQDAREQLSRAVRAVFESWDTPARAGLPAGAPHPGRPRHRSQRRPDGLRQQGRRARRPASASRATLRPAKPGSTASSSPMRRARTSSPESARPSRSSEMQQSAPRGLRAVHATRCAGSRSTTATCRTSSSRSRTGALYLLQTRTAKRTAAAALKSAVDMVDEGLISREEAVARIDPGQLDQLLHPMIDPAAERRGRRAGAERLARARRPGRSSSTPTPRPSAAGRRGRDPRPLGDDPGRHPRDDRRARGS